MWQQKRATHTHLSHVDDSLEAPDHPILSGELKRMLEMTTSGSGSGEPFLIKDMFFTILLKCFQYKVSILGFFVIFYCFLNYNELHNT